MKDAYQAFVGYTLKYERLKKDLSLRALAEELNVSHTVIANIEKAKIPLSPSLLSIYEQYLAQRFMWDEDLFKTLFNNQNDLFEAILFHDYSYLVSLKEALTPLKENAKKAGLSFFWDFLCFLVQSNDYAQVLTVPLSDINALKKMSEDLNPMSHLVLELSLALYDRYHFRLSSAKTRLERLSSSYLNPHYKALVNDRLSDIYYHTFDRAKAISFAKEAIKTYQTFHNTHRAILSEIKMNLYGLRQHQTEKELPYLKFIEQANIYKLTEVIHDISYVWALRVFRFKRFEEAKRILQRLDLSHPQFYHYYVIILFGARQYDELKAFIESTALKYPMLDIFKPALDYVNAYLRGAPDDELETLLNIYLDNTLKEELYGETRWAETLLDDFYVRRRRYKEATLLKERLIQLILT